jgi:acyl carrier protein
VSPALAEGLELIGVDPALPDDAILTLTSLQVVTLVEHLEQELDVELDGRDVTRENFSSKRALRALVTALLARKARKT